MGGTDAPARECTSLRGGEADAAIQLHRVISFPPPHRQREEPNLWIAASAAPPRNDGVGAGWASDV